MIYLKQFENLSDYDTYVASESFVAPNVSYIPNLQEGEEVKYIKEVTPPAPSDTTLVMKFETTSTSQNVMLFDTYSSGYEEINYIEIDGVEADIEEIKSNDGFITIATTGEHVVKYRFTDPSSIPESLFVDCGYTSIYIPDGITSLDGFFWLYEGDSDLESITVDSNNPTYDSRNNCNAIIETSTNKLILGCKNTTIPNDVTIIDDKAFVHVQGLQNIVIGNNVTEIGAQAFRYNNVVETIDIGTSIAHIGSQAFADCSYLESATIRATTPPTLSNNANPFYRSNCTIYVPAESVDTYKAATEWSRYASRIEAIP